MHGHHIEVDIVAKKNANVELVLILLNSPSSTASCYAFAFVKCDAYACQVDLVAHPQHSFSLAVFSPLLPLILPLNRLSMLYESDVGAFLAEALAADVQTIFSDQTSAVGADPAVKVIC